jgi:hypothetical protein
MPHVEVIDAQNTSITGKCLPRLTLPALQVLRLRDSPVTDAFLCDAHFPKLQVLDIGGTKVTSQCISELRMTNITRLEIDNTAIDAEGLAQLSRFSALSDLRVDYEDLSPDAVRVIQHLPLRRLQVNCPKGSENEATELLSGLPRDWKVVLRTREKN